MKKVLFYGMTKEKMCFQHILMNALDLHQANAQVQVIFEGASVTLIPVFEAEKNALYLQCKELGLIAGACLACSKMLQVYDEVVASGLDLIGEMMGHAPMKPYVFDGYEVISL